MDCLKATPRLRDKRGTAQSFAAKFNINHYAVEEPDCQVKTRAHSEVEADEVVFPLQRQVLNGHLQLLGERVFGVRQRSLSCAQLGEAGQVGQLGRHTR